MNFREHAVIVSKHTSAALESLADCGRNITPGRSWPGPPCRDSCEQQCLRWTTGRAPGRQRPEEQEAHKSGAVRAGEGNLP